MRLGPIALLLAAAPAFSQTRPLLTEEASTAPARSLVLELGADLIGGEPNFLTGKERDRWELPVLRLVYSPADNVELDLEWTGRILARRDPDLGDVSDWGDVVLRTKVRFLEERKRRPGLSARFAVALPETSSLQGLAPNTLRMSAQVLLSRSTRFATLHLNAGLAIQDRPLSPHDQSDFLAYGVALVRPLGDRAAVMAEVAGLGAGRGAPGADRRAEARAGLRFGRDRLRVDAAVRRGLAAADGEWGATAGLAWTLRRGR